MSELNVEGYGWSDGFPPDLEKGVTMGRMRACKYCGSAHPEDVADAIRKGAKGSFADRKYGWPHKAYFLGVPYPYAGMLESNQSHNSPPIEEINQGKWISIPDGFDANTGEPKTKWVAAGKPALDTTYVKFYTIHLQDVSDEDRETIERHLGLRFKFEGDAVSWEPFT